MTTKPSGLQRVALPCLALSFALASAAHAQRPDPEVGGDSVTLRYGREPARSIPGPLATIRWRDPSASAATNPAEALKGRLAGVDVVAASHAPGAVPDVQIRPARSLALPSAPLFVLDGTPLAGGLVDIDPADLAEVTVLRGATAAAMYGSMAAGGAVLLTTRRGEPGRPRFVYDGHVGFREPLRRAELFTGPEFAEYRREAYRTAGRYTSDAEIFSPAELASLEAGRSTDWQGEILRTGLQQSHRVGISAGSATTRLSLGATRLTQDGITLGEGFERSSLSINAEYRPGRRFRSGASVHLGHTNQDLGGGGTTWAQALRQSPLAPPRDASGEILFLPTPDRNLVNPISQALNHSDTRERLRLVAALHGELSLARGLSWRVSLGPDLSRVRGKEYRGSETASQRGHPAYEGESSLSVRAYTLDNVLRFEKGAREGHRVDASLAYSIQRQDVEEEGSEPGASFRRWEEGAARPVLARAGYGWRNQVVLSASGALERATPNSPFALFPTVGAVWHLAGGPARAEPGSGAALSLRAGWGVIGSTPFGPYRRPDRTRWASATVGVGPDFTWERARELNLGMDFSLAADRLAGTVDVFHARSSDVLLAQRTPSATVFVNGGRTRSRGVEVSLTSINVDGPGGLRWSTTLNAAAGSSEIVGLYGDTRDDVGNRWFIGRPTRVFHDYEFDGIWQLDEAEEAARYSQAPGQIRVVDQNRDGRIDMEDRVVLGSPDPRWTAGLGNRLDWKGLSLAFLVAARQGFLVQSGLHTSYNTLTGRFNNLRVDYWTPTNPGGTAPRPSPYSEAPLYGSSLAYRDGSFVQVRSVDVAYTLPRRILGRAAPAAVQLYGSALDPLLFTRYHDLHPEGDGVAPAPRTLLLGLKAGL